MESYCQCRGAFADFLGFHKSSRKVCTSWALPLNKRVRVSACKIRNARYPRVCTHSPQIFSWWFIRKQKIGSAPLSQTSQLLLDFGSELIWNMQMLVWRFWDNLFALILPKGLHFHLIIWHYSDKLHVNCNSFWYFLFLWLFFFDFHTTFMQRFWIFIEDNVA